LRLKKDLIVDTLFGLGDVSWVSSGTNSRDRFGVDLEETNEGVGDAVIVMVAAEGDMICAREVVFLGFGLSICGIGEM